MDICFVKARFAFAKATATVIKGKTLAVLFPAFGLLAAATLFK